MPGIGFDRRMLARLTCDPSGYPEPAQKVGLDTRHVLEPNPPLPRCYRWRYGEPDQGKR